MEKFVVSVGDAFSGLTLYGPFDDEQDALEFGDTVEGSEWTIVCVQSPKALEAAA